METDYPIYIPSKGRSDNAMTPDALAEDNVPFSLVVEPQEEDDYREAYPADEYPDADILVLPENDIGLNNSRNWIKKHSREQGDKRHWQLDDNLSFAGRRFNARRMYCDFGYALHQCERFTDRYTNVAVSGLNYAKFLTSSSSIPPFYRNQRVYSCSLILNETEHEWRAEYNDDTDMCLQVLGDGWCTILLNAFFVWKEWTMVMSGGNTEDLDYYGDGRSKMARSLERRWPGVVETTRRFGRPQHRIKHEWRKFDTPLELRDDIDLDDLDGESVEDAELHVKGEIQGEDMRNAVERYRDIISDEADGDGHEAHEAPASETE